MMSVDDVAGLDGENEIMIKHNESLNNLISKKQRRCQWWRRRKGGRGRGKKHPQFLGFQSLLAPVQLPNSAAFVQVRDGSFSFGYLQFSCHVRCYFQSIAGLLNPKLRDFTHRLVAQPESILISCLLEIEFDVILCNKLYLRLFGWPALVVVD
jgi:hypothetical protein